MTAALLEQTSFHPSCSLLPVSRYQNVMVWADNSQQFCHQMLRVLRRTCYVVSQGRFFETLMGPRGSSGSFFLCLPLLLLFVKREEVMPLQDGTVIIEWRKTVHAMSAEESKVSARERKGATESFYSQFHNFIIILHKVSLCLRELSLNIDLSNKITAKFIPLKIRWCCEVYMI